MSDYIPSRLHITSLSIDMFFYYFFFTIFFFVLLAQNEFLINFMLWIELKTSITKEYIERKKIPR